MLRSRRKGCLSQLLTTTFDHDIHDIPATHLGLHDALQRTRLTDELITTENATDDWTPRVSIATTSQRAKPTTPHLTCLKLHSVTMHHRYFREDA
jgi:hypothetical protein